MEEDLWKSVFPDGTEFNLPWKFSNLKAAFEEGGKLYREILESGKNVYLFCLTEPHVLEPPYKGENEYELFLVPVVAAVLSHSPPSNVIFIGSEEGVPMEDVDISWVSFSPRENRDCPVKSQIFILSGTPRATLKDCYKTYEYCQPYFYEAPEFVREEKTVVQIKFDGGPMPVVCEYNWVLDKLNEFTDKLIREDKLDEDQKDAFKKFVRAEVRAEAERRWQARLDRRNAFIAQFENMRLYKFYPDQTPDTPYVFSKGALINSYFRLAHEVF